MELAPFTNIFLRSDQSVTKLRLPFPKTPQLLNVTISLESFAVPQEFEKFSEACPGRDRARLPFPSGISSAIALREPIESIDRGGGKGGGNSQSRVSWVRHHILPS